MVGWRERMVTLIRTFKRINKSAPPALAPAPPTQRSSSRSSKTKIIVTTTAATAPTPRNIDTAIAIAANHFHHCSQLKKTANTATDDHKLNEKVGARAKAKAPSNNTSNDSLTPKQKAKPIAIANTSNVSYDAAAKSNERNIQTLSDRKRKSSSVEEPAPKKVARKGYRYECSADGCTNKVATGGVCVKHGAKVKRCSSEGCTNHVANGGVCVRHGAIVKRCSSEGCTNQAKKGGVCRRHGAQVKRCSSEGCTNQAVKGGVCKSHGAKIKQCSSEGCTNYARKGGVCRRHGAKVKRCSVERCTNQALKGGICIKHGAKVKRCSSEGCTNQAQRRGVCIRHGAYRNTQDESTAFGSEYEKTTATQTLPNQRASRSSLRESERRRSVPEEVTKLCQEVVEV